MWADVIMTTWDIRELYNYTYDTYNGTFTLTLYLKTFAVGVLKFYQVHNKYMWVNISSRYVPNIPHVNKLS